MKCRSLFAPGGGSQPFSGGEMCAWIEDARKMNEARTTEEGERERERNGGRMERKWGSKLKGDVFLFTGNPLQLPTDSPRSPPQRMFFGRYSGATCPLAGETHNAYSSKVFTPSRRPPSACAAPLVTHTRGEGGDAAVCRRRGRVSVEEGREGRCMIEGV